MFRTWEELDQLLSRGIFPLEMAIGGTFSLEEFDAAFRPALAGTKSKILLLPQTRAARGSLRTVEGGSIGPWP